MVDGIEMSPVQIARSSVGVATDTSGRHHPTRVNQLSDRFSPDTASTTSMP